MLQVWNRLGSLWQHWCRYCKRNGESSWGQFDLDHGSSTNRAINYCSLQKLTIKVKNKKTRYVLQSHFMALRKCISLVDANLQYILFTQVIKWEVHTEHFLSTWNAVVLFHGCRKGKRLRSWSVSCVTLSVQTMLFLYLKKKKTAYIKIYGC